MLNAEKIAIWNKLIDNEMKIIILIVIKWEDRNIWKTVEKTIGIET